MINKIKTTQIKTAAVFSFIFMLLSLISFFMLQNFQHSVATTLASRTAEVLATTINQARISYSAHTTPLDLHPDITVEALYHGKPLSLPNPTTFAIELGEAVTRSSAGFMLHTYSQYPFKNRENIGGPQDSFQHDALSQLTTSSPTFERIEELNGIQVSRYAEAIFMTKSCVTCHNNHPDSPKKDWRVGDVRGAIDIAIPLNIDEKDLSGTMRYSYVIFISFSIISLSCIFITLKRALSLSQELEHKVKERTTVLNEIAHTDSLTLIANHRSYVEFCDKIIQQQTPFSVIIYDLDYFKKINDKYGHDVGDECLIAVVNAVSSALRKDDDFHARIGGEEFAIILTNTSMLELDVIAKRVLKCVKDINIPQHNDIKITCSMGSTLITKFDGATIKDIIKVADNALYEAKKLGRDRWVHKHYNIN